MISAKVIWQDEHIVEVRISASNGVFAGEVDAYTTYEELSSVLHRLRGFPRVIGDQVEIKFDEPPGNVFRLALEARTAGPCDGRVEIVTDNPVGDTASFNLQIEPAAIDNFVRELENVIASRAGVAEFH